MQFDQYYVVFLKKGPVWTGEPSPRLDALQEAHLAHLDRMRQSGNMTVSGPVDVHSESTLRGISVYRYNAFASVDELRLAVEQDPMIQAGHLAAEYQTWYIPAGARLEGQA